jgi:hypothetical protein
MAAPRAIPIDPEFARQQGSSVGRGLTILLILAAFGVAAIGLLFLSNATSGVGILSLACLLAICARIAQASAHHRELWTAIERLQAVPAAATPPPATPTPPAKPPVPPMTNLEDVAKYYGVTSSGDRK